MGFAAWQGDAVHCRHHGQRTPAVLATAAPPSQAAGGTATLPATWARCRIPPSSAGYGLGPGETNSSVPWLLDLLSAGGVIAQAP
jgi:hypothetical protein